MALACQKNSYLKEFRSKVVSCEPASIKQVSNGKKATLNGFNVILEDTILFPEGGGQPDDRGKINGIDVLRVEKCGQDVRHFVPSPLDADTDVDIKLDWLRRFDHMQQHSGQHLITAVINEKYGYDTTSWWLGEKTSFIELDAPTLTLEEMRYIEDTTNDKIRAGIGVTVTLYDDKNDSRLSEARTRGLPDDLEGSVRIVTIDGIEDDLCCGTHVSNTSHLQARTRGLPDDVDGSIRIVTIDGMEDNMCCGTHVSSLSHLQAVKLLSVEKGKKNKCNLVFLVGNRVLDYLQQCCDRERALTALLKNQPEDHPMLVEKMQKSFQVSRKACSQLLRDVAVFEAQKFKSNGVSRLLCLHRKEGDNEFMNIIVNEVNDPNVILFLSVGEENGAGNFILASNQEVIDKVASRVAELLEGKGAGKKGKYQGKANKLSNRKKVEQLLREYLDQES